MSFAAFALKSGTGLAAVYLVLGFPSKFAHKVHAVETITMVKEADGTWKSAGYFIK